MSSERWGEDPKLVAVLGEQGAAWVPARLQALRRAGVVPHGAHGEAGTDLRGSGEDGAALRDPASNAGGLWPWDGYWARALFARLPVVDECVDGDVSGFVLPTSIAESHQGALVGAEISGCLDQGHAKEPAA